MLKASNTGVSHNASGAVGLFAVQVAKQDGGGASARRAAMDDNDAFLAGYGASQAVPTSVHIRGVPGAVVAVGRPLVPDRCILAILSVGHRALPGRQFAEPIARSAMAV
jgi:NADPH:quinone reductase-like Zn-dependent oxidoreductase